jgi:hypothetical protein
MPVSLRPPEGCAGAGIGQLDLVPNEHGIVEIPDGIDFSELLNHGFTPCSEADLVPLRLAAAKAEEDKFNAAVEARVKEIMAGNALFGKRAPVTEAKPSPAVQEPAPAETATKEAPAQDAAPDPAGGPTAPAADAAAKPKK